jgi:hypothetical protein
MPDSWGRRWGPALVLLPVVAIFFGFFLGSGTIQLALRGVEATAVVDAEPDLIKDTDGDYYKAWVAYEYPTGVDHREYIRIPNGTRRGSEIFVLLDPDNPGNVDWRPKSDHMASLIIMPILGTLMLGYIGYLIVKRRRRSV